MEPFINGDLRSARNLDLTPSLMKDMGWELETLKLGKCDTGIPNALPNGQLLHVNVEVCAAGAKNHGKFVSCMVKVGLEAWREGLLEGIHLGPLASCAARGF